MEKYRSDELDQLEQAILNAHQNIGVIIEKGSKGPRSTYANLPAILVFIKKFEKEYGLLITSGPRVINGITYNETKISHPKSKQWIIYHSLLNTIASNSSISPDQAYGISVTYHRRYDIMACLGLFAEDDPSDNDGEHKEDVISDKQLNLLNLEIKNSGRPPEQFYDKIKQVYKIKDIVDLPKNEFNEVLKFVTGNKKKE